MSYRFIYSNPDLNRIIQSVLIEKRSAIPAIKNRDGHTIKDYCDQVSSQVDANTIFYKIETEDGNLVGFFSLRAFSEGTASLIQYELTPAFVQFDSDISGEIYNFMQSGNWAVDILN